MRQESNISWQVWKKLFVYFTKMYMSHKTQLPFVYAAQMLHVQYFRGAILVFGRRVSLIWINHWCDSKNFSKKRSSQSLHFTLSDLCLEIWAIHSFSIFNLYPQPSSLHIHGNLLLAQRLEHFHALSKTASLAEGVIPIISFLERQDGHMADLPSPVQSSSCLFADDFFANGPNPHFLHGSPRGPDFCGLNFNRPPAKDSNISCQWYMNNKSMIHSQIQSGSDILYTLCTFVFVKYNVEQQNFFFSYNIPLTEISIVDPLRFPLSVSCSDADKKTNIFHWQESEKNIYYLIQQGFVNLYFSDTCKLWYELCYLLQYRPAFHGVLYCPHRNHIQRLKRRLCILYSEDLGIYIF